MRAYQHPTTKNFGDTLPLPILRHLGHQAERADRDETGKVVTVGSVMNVTRPGDWVWGTGVQHDRRYSAARTKFLAVRGPITRASIDNVHIPQVYGDPALLLPHLYDPDVDVRHDVGVIPHYLDAIQSRRRHPDYLHISVKMPWQHIIRQIKSCKHIIATSLHGIIAADAYGIPVTWHGSYSQKVASTNLKFQDYFLATRGSCQRPGRIPPLPRDEWTRLCDGLTHAARHLPR